MNQTEELIAAAKAAIAEKNNCDLPCACHETEGFIGCQQLAETTVNAIVKHLLAAGCDENSRLSAAFDKLHA